MSKNRRRLEEIKRYNRMVAMAMDSEGGGNLGPREIHVFLARGLRLHLNWLCWYHGISNRDRAIERVAKLLDEIENTE